MIRRRYWWIGATATIVISLGAIHGALTQAAAPAALPPAAATEVPTSLPPEGVEIHHQAILKPTNFKSVISRQEALKLVSHYARIGPIPPRAILVNFTAPQSLRPAGYQGAATVINNVPAWVVTLTAPTPQQVVQTQPGTPQSDLPAPVRHFNVVISAQTGQFLFGFFTH
ncbi:MAG: hypothetical protein M1294_01075 [Firmicutes bacterium]|uniref:Uncharacterized protein n=1 Tax=Sulfobacillus benefaciens TaxID=453960 RepID=A0A2T2WF85_9FIRM|nr:hypothetical protein [Bacillota bacterium]MCL5012711.1 hypothetical protein [Bacillota bacterium]PSR20896.1 MAG: hypothetical protein C7B43_21640 [Sulfobacillus benefaciens]